MRPLILLLILASASTALAGGDLVVHDAWIPTAPPNAPALAGYLTIENHADRDRSLVGATSPAFGRIMAHRTEQVDGVVRMIPVPSADVPANGTLVFQPGGYHLMLMRPTRPLRPGDRVPIELRFADGSRTSVTFSVLERAAAPTHHGAPASGQRSRP